MLKILRSSTSLTLIISLSLPPMAMAQSTPLIDPAELATCAADIPVPCLLEDGTIQLADGTIVTADEYEALAMAEAAAAAATAQAEADAAAAQAEADAAAAQAAADAAEAAAAQAADDAAAQADADAKAAAEAAAAQAAADAAAAQAEADAAAAQAEADAAAANAAADAAAQAEADAQAAADAAAAQAADDAASADATAKAEADAQAAADAAAIQAAADAAAASEAAAATDAAAQTDADAKAAADAAAIQAAADAAAATTEVAPEEAPVVLVEPLPEPTAEETAQAQAALDAVLADPTAELTAADAEALSAQQETGVIAEPETVVATDAGLTEDAAAAEATAEAAQAPEAPSAAAAAAQTDAAAPETQAAVTTTTVTAADVRTSDQDFAKTKKDKAGNKANKKQGLSDLEKIILLGLGAAVVGKVLSNRSTVVQNSGDRIVVQRPDGRYEVLKDDDALIRQTGDQVQTQTFSDGSTITTLVKPNGDTIKTIRDAEGRVLRRSRVLPDGQEYVLFDDTAVIEKVDVTTLPRMQSATLDYTNDDAAFEAAMNTVLDNGVDRRFSLSQIRNIRAVRELVPQIDLDSITFDTGSAAIRSTEAEKLARLGLAMQRAISQRPGEVFLIEGHTDAVGSAASNLTLSDRRAESLALALTEYFDIPPENLVVQGYGESYLKVPTTVDERTNRRVAVRRITPLLRMDMAQN